MSIKISQLPVLATASNGTVLASVDGGVTQQLGLPTLKTYLLSTLNQTSVVTYSATPVFNLVLGNIQKIVLTGDVSSSTATNQQDSIEYTFIIVQDIVGNHNFTWPSNFKGTGQIINGSTSGMASIINVQKFVYVQLDGFFYATTPLISF